MEASGEACIATVRTLGAAPPFWRPRLRRTIVQSAYSPSAHELAAVLGMLRGLCTTARLTTPVVLCISQDSRYEVVMVSASRCMNVVIQGTPVAYLRLWLQHAILVAWVHEFERLP